MSLRVGWVAPVVCWLAGCATTRPAPEAAAREVVERSAERSFYAPWYEASAVVLPPPPEAARRP